MKIVVASENPIKTDAVKYGFASFFNDINVVGIKTESGINDQPLTDMETLTGARNRIREARRIIPDAKFWVGIEGGIQNMEKGLAAFAWIVISSEEKSGEARTSTFLLPESVAVLVEGGLELGTANDLVFNQSNSKQNSGAVGLLTHNVVDRMELYRQAVILALIPFINPALY